MLLVEDDPDNLELLSSYLEAEGAVTYSASSIAAALAMVIGNRVDVVVSDLELPDGDGCALLGQLAITEQRGKRPAIAITGYSQEAWRSRASSCGFSRYAVKPFSMDQLIAWIFELSRASDVGDETVES